MPIFRTNLDIFKRGSEESFDSRKYSLGKNFIAPPNKKWDYTRELEIDDVELWEVIYEENGGIGVYAAWDPYAEFYMIRNKTNIDLYYGKGAQKKAIKKMKELKMPIGYNRLWVEKEDLWLYL